MPPRRRPPLRYLPVGAAALLFVLGLTSCTPTLSITTDPSLFPTFSSSVSDYVSRCDDSAPVDVAVTAPDGVTVSVDGQEERSGNFTAEVTRDVGQRFSIVVDGESTTTTHHVRCLPAEFPSWTFERSGTPQAEYYLTTVSQTIGQGWTTLFDSNGVPIWWLPPREDQTIFATVLPNKNVAWTRFTYPGFDVQQGIDVTEVGLDGRMVRQLSTVGAPADFHDVLLLPNGNYAMVTIEPKNGVDTTPLGGTEDGAIVNHVIQEVTPTGELVWSWDVSQHIPLTEGGYLATAKDEEGRYDAYHWNSIEWAGDGFVLSFRHLDAIYKVNRTSGAIDWKVGGTARPESLTVVGDPVFVGGGGFSGQHDARMSGDTLTLFDNGTVSTRPPRAVAYRLDEELNTATLLEDVRDPDAESSGCCGSTRKLPGGHWVTAWGGLGLATENEPNGDRVMRLQAGGMYRFVPVPDGLLTADELRIGMDTQYPK